MAPGNFSFARAAKYLRIVRTFLIVSLAWVFFRAPDLHSALDYFARLFALKPAQPGADLLSGIVYQPYYAGSFVLAAIAAWKLPTVWEWTQQITWPKALLCLVALWISLAVLMTQAYNPFIYFIF